MQGKLLYEYAVIRVVPRVEREEFLNIGVILYCPERQFLKALFELKEERLSVFNKQLDIAQLEEYVNAILKVCEGRKQGGPIGQLPLSSRFRWLTASRSTVIQSSKVHSGFCVDPDQCISQLFEQQVL